MRSDFRKNLGNKFYWLLAKISPELYFRFKALRPPLKRWLNLKNPETYADKMVWLTLNWRHPLKTKCADKYRVREYLKECGCEELAVPLLGVWERAEDVDFDKLPSRFVIKCNHGCGMNIVVKDKAKLDLDETRRTLNKWLKMNYGYAELQYRDIPPRIIAEEFLDDGVHEMPVDYKVFCINGKVFGCNAIMDRGTGDNYGYKEVLMDRNWQRVMAFRNEQPPDLICEKPARYEQMMQYAERLAKPFPIVRVDFYYVRDKIYLGELTFTSAGGLGVAFSDEAQKMMGREIILPNEVTK